METNKIKSTVSTVLLAAVVGGAAAIGGYKMLGNNSEAGSSFEKKQSVYFANNEQNISSAGAPDFVAAAAAVSPGVVNVITTIEARNGSRGEGMNPMDMFEDFFGGRGGRIQQGPAKGSGSGVIISDDGYIVTNNHVVADGSKIEVILNDKRKMQAKVIGTDPNTDLALIKVDARNLPVVKLGNSDNVQVGEWVLAVGFPLNLQSTVTAGIVSAKRRTIGILAPNMENMTREQYEQYRRTGTAPTNQSIESYIQTDAAINRGNSGGALVNARGELVGINSAIASQNGMNEGYGFAIPVNLAKKILDDFLKYGKVRRGYVGISFRPIDADFAAQNNIKDVNGLYVNEVVPNGGAAAAGIKKGDIIKSIDGAAFDDASYFQERIGRMSPGDRVRLGVQTGGQLRDVVVTLKGQESIATQRTAGTENSTGASNNAGARLRAATSAEKQQYGVNSGVVVTAVEPGKAFDNFGVPAGLLIVRINDIPVNTPEEARAAFAKTRNGMVKIAGVDREGAMTFSYPAK